MAIESVSSSSNAYASNVATQQAKEARPAQSAERPPEPKKEERVEKKEEAPKPVINAQGQQTGNRINTTA